MTTDYKITIFASPKDTAGRESTLAEWIEADRTAHREKVEAIRRESDPKRRRRLKAALPCAAISGIFTGGHAAADMIRHTGLICVDIDATPSNTQSPLWPRMGEILRSLDCVLYAARSCSGNGYFAVIPVAHPQHHKAHFNFLQKAFGDLWGISLDDNCKDLTRLRFATYDPAAYVNESAKILTGLINEPEAPAAASGFTEENTLERIERYLEQIEASQTDITGSYAEWLKVGMAFASLGEAGREYYHRASQFYAGYSRPATDTKFNSLLKSATGEISLGSFFGLCHTYGIFGVSQMYSGAAADFAGIDLEAPSADTAASDEDYI